MPVLPHAQQPFASPVPPPTLLATPSPPSARLHPTAPSFVPRQSKITIKSPNGQAVDLQKFRIPDGSLESPVGENLHNRKPDRRSITRIESEFAQKTRLKEEKRWAKAKRKEEKAKREEEVEFRSGRI